MENMLAKSIVLVAVAMLVGLRAEMGEGAPTTTGSPSGCPYAAGLCPSDCGQKVDANGCRRCLCGVPYFRWPQRQCPSSRRHCPLDCGHILDELGCKKCFCGTNPFYRFPWMPRPIKKPGLSKNVQPPTPPSVPKQEPEFLLDVRTFEGPTRPVTNGTNNRLQEEGFVF